MNDSLELVCDGDSLAVIGQPGDVERFFLDHGFNTTATKSLDLSRVSARLRSGGTALQTGAQWAEQSGRWVMLTAESAEAVKQYGLMPSKAHGVRHAMIGRPGEIKQWLQISKGPASLANPLALSSVSTIMLQQAMQQQMEQIIGYLEAISEDVADILRSQKDAVLADMIGVDLVIEDALTVRDRVGRVSGITWSKVQAAEQTIARTQAYSIRQLEAIASKLEAKADLGEIAKATAEAEPQVREWLAVIARCFQLRDSVAVLELDRVLDASPEDLDAHRAGLVAARKNRIDLISGVTSRLLAHMEETVRTANAKVLLNPFDAPAAVESSNNVAVEVLEFRDHLGIGSGHETDDARRWIEAASEAGREVLTQGTEAAAAVRRFGKRSLGRVTQAARSARKQPEETAQLGAPEKPENDRPPGIVNAANDVAGRVGSLFTRNQPTTNRLDDGTSDPLEERE